MKKNKFTFHKLLNEQNLSGKKTKPLVNAIVKRNPVTFYYSGPKKPPKDSVKPGVRIRAEIVAMGLSKKGNLIVRAYVQPPSVSKKGFEKHGWRTFIVNRMSNINVLTDETFDNKRPEYKEGNESKRGPMVVTYVTSDWTEKPTVSEPEVEPTTMDTPEPEIEPTTPIDTPEPETDELPQPKVVDKPSPLPDYEENNHVLNVYKNLENKVKDVNGQKTITTSDYDTAKKELYKKKESEWISKQRELGLNIMPGEGTRKRFEVTSNLELSKELRNNNINVVSNIPEPIQENIKRIKDLISQLN
jgi:outer membrane biosynthesis protein TonB